MLKLEKIHSKHIAEPVWHIQVALLIAIGLQFLLDSNLSIGSKYALAISEILFIILLALIRPKERPSITHLRRTIALILISIITITNLTSLILVINDLFHPGVVDGKDLIISAISIYFTNIIVFGIWYWELDSDGSSEELPPDFLFPQTANPSNKLYKDWYPTFFDYLYFSSMNAMSFNPSDTVPLTHRAKLLTMIQSMISIITIALVVTRAVSILY